MEGESAMRAGAIHKRARTKNMWAYIFLFPQSVFFILFTIYPMVMSYVYVFYDWGGIGPLERFVGWDNFREVMTDTLFWKSYKNSFLYMCGTVILVMPASLLFAILLNSKWTVAKTLFRTLYFVPVVSTTAIVGVVMRIIFGNDNSISNTVLINLGILDNPVPWLLQPATAMMILIGVGSWLFFGMCMVYWLAVLQSLPPEVYEAAKVDGVNFWGSLRYITIPLLMPSILVILLLNIVNAFNVFDLVATLTEGGPFFATQTVDLYVYNIVFASEGLPRIGYGSTVSVIFGFSIFIITGIVSLLIKISRDNNSRKKGYGL